METKVLSKKNVGNLIQTSIQLSNKDKHNNHNLIANNKEETHNNNYTNRNKTNKRAFYNTYKRDKDNY
jgi:hypothetical protein